MSYGKCWVCGRVMLGDSQTIEGNVKCDACGWVSGKDGSY
jgi:DNA-directed RNA polymerase subunit RPC12/RpoP